MAADPASFPSVMGMPGYVLNWETNMSRQLWNDSSLMFPGAGTPPEPVLQYQDRQSRPVDRERFILDVQRRDERNLP